MALGIGSVLYALGERACVCDLLLLSNQHTSRLRFRVSMRVDVRDGMRVGVRVGMRVDVRLRSPPFLSGLCIPHSYLVFNQWEYFVCFQVHPPQYRDVAIVTPSIIPTPQSKYFTNV